MRELADIASLRAFVAVVAAGSFSDAARRVRLTRSALGKAVARLEELLGTRLLHRTTRRIGLTADGRTLYESAVRILADLEQAQDEVMRGRAAPRGVLRLTATEAFGRQVVLPILTEFIDSWTELTAETSFTDRIADIVTEGFDVAIRFGEPIETPDLICRVVARSSARLCASPAYLERHGAPGSLEDLPAHRLLVFGTRQGPARWRLMDGAGSTTDLPVRPALLSDNAGALRDAALGGLGIALLPRFLSDGDVASGELHAVLPDYETPEIPISVLYPTRRHLAPKVRLFVELLSERLPRPAGRATGG